MYKHTPDRRTNDRFNLSLPTKAYLFDDTKSQYSTEHTLITKDINHTGAYFITENTFPLSGDLKLILNLDDILVKATAKVVRLDKNGFAVNFYSTELFNNATYVYDMKKRKSVSNL